MQVSELPVTVSDVTADAGSRAENCIPVIGAVSSISAACLKLLRKQIGMLPLKHYFR